MTGPSPYLAAANYMRTAGIARVIVCLDVHVDEARDSVEWWPVIVARWDQGTERVRPFPSGLDRLAALCWDAVEARHEDPQGNYVVESDTTNPQGYIRQVSPCFCDPRHGSCRACHDTGWLLDAAKDGAA